MQTTYPQCNFESKTPKILGQNHKFICIYVYGKICIFWEFQKNSKGTLFTIPCLTDDNKPTFTLACILLCAVGSIAFLSGILLVFSLQNGMWRSAAFSLNLKWKTEQLLKRSTKLNCNMLTQDEPTKIHMSKEFLQFQETNYADSVLWLQVIGLSGTTSYPQFGVWVLRLQTMLRRVAMQDNNSGLYTPYQPWMFNAFLLTKFADSSDFTWLELSLLRLREKP